MVEQKGIITKNDILILKELNNLNRLIKITNLCDRMNKPHKILSPRIDNLKNLNLVKIKIEGRKKLVSVNPQHKEFIKKLIFLTKKKSITNR